MNFAKWKRLTVVFLLGMAAINVAVLWSERNFALLGYGDFASFYTAGKLAQSGEASHLYDRDAQWRVQQEFASSVTIRQGPLPYIRPPFEALFFVPFAYLEYKTAYLVWTAVKILILFAIPFLLNPYLPGRALLPPLLTGVVLLSYAPVAVDLLHGQDAILFFLIFILAFIALRRGAEVSAGLWLGAALFKFHLVLPIILIFLLRRKLRLVGGFAVAAVAVAIVSGLTVGWNTLLTYPEYLWHLNRASNAGVVAPQTMVNVRGLTTLLFGRIAMPAHMNWFLIPVMILGSALGALAWRPSDDRDSRLMSAGFSLAIVLTILGSYYAYSYDLTLLALPIMLLGDLFLTTPEIPLWSKRLFYGAAGVLLFSPLFWVMILRLTELYWLAFAVMAFAASLPPAMKVWRRQPLPAYQASGRAEELKAC